MARSHFNEVASNAPTTVKPAPDFAASEEALLRVSAHTRTIFSLGLGLMALIAVLRVQQGAVLSSLMLSMLLFQALATLGLWLTRKKRKAAGVIALFALFVVEGLTLVQFGPFAGVGMLVALSVVVAVANFGLRVGILTLVGTTLLIALLGGVLTIEPGRALPNPELDQFASWTRTALVTLTLGSFVLFTLDLLFGTLRRKAEEARAAQELEAEARSEQEVTARALARARELETVGRLAAGVAHDFNNALTVILICSIELRKHTLPPSAESLANDIEGAARAAATTTAQLTAFGRRQQTPQASSCDPGVSLAQNLKNLHRLLPEDISLSTSFEAGTEVPLGPGDLLQVVINLVLNARDACPSGGALRLSVQRRGEGVTIEVEDNGVGMDEATQGRLFDHFFTTKGGRGTGLGLAMVHATVTRAGGHVEVTSALARGTSVRVHLPSAPGSRTDLASIHSERPRQLELSGLSVLVVEDERTIRRAMRRSLEQVGAKVEEAPSSREALSLLKMAPHLDLLCTDGVLGDGTALPVVREFCERYPNAPVLLCSGHVPDELEHRGLHSPNLARLPKPFTGEELVRAVERLTRRSH